MTYKSSRRQWVKLWVNEWLDGTTRFELTPQQRLLWVDLLALAGRSRFPGFIYAGIGEGGKRVGYPIAYLAGVLQMDEVTLNNSLKLLADHEHVTLEKSASEKYIIGIVNWEKYQSEYLRQRTYRKVTTKNTQRLLVEGEGEVEGEEDVEGEADAQTSRGHAIQWPAGFALTEEMRLYAIQHGVSDPAQEFEHFENHHQARGNRFKSWRRAWNTWVLNSSKFGGNGKNGGGETQRAKRNREIIDRVFASHAR